MIVSEELIKSGWSLVWGHMPVIPPLRSWRQENQSKVIFSYIGTWSETLFKNSKNLKTKWKINKSTKRHPRSSWHNMCWRVFCTCLEQSEPHSDVHCDFVFIVMFIVLSSQQPYSDCPPGAGDSDMSNTHSLSKPADSLVGGPVLDVNNYDTLCLTL